MLGLRLGFEGRESSLHQELGRFVAVMKCSPWHANLPMAYFNYVVEPAIRHRQYKIIYDERGNPLGYFIWAGLADDVHQRMIRGGPWHLHISEWNEGERYWIVDFCAPAGYIKDVINLIRGASVFPAGPIYYRKRRDGQLIVKALFAEEMTR